jgi:hypothetical protein
MRLRLVQDWRRGWRWASVQLMALSAAIQFGAGLLPPWLHDALPAVWWKYLAGAMLVCAMLARFIRQNLEPDVSDGEAPECR